VLLIEDACEALGTSDVNGKKAGNLSLAGSFSFYYGHHISTIEGGAVTTNDTKLYNLMLSIRSHGWSRDVDSNFKEEWKKEYNIDDVREFYTFYYPGFNLRSTDLNAFIGISQLDKMEEIIKVRENNYNFYNKYLEGKYWKQESKYAELSSFAYGTIVENRMEVFNHLKKNNIEVRPLICGSMGKQPFWIKKYGHTPLEVADVIHDYGLYLPNHLYLDEEKIKFVCEKFKEVAIPKFF
jgi:CDP-6-deoxy-D-xylo-4-hexulose-3-dehydrase